MYYLCNRNRESTVPWMSGLVSGLQNRARRFESARNLEIKNPFCLLRKGFFIRLYISVKEVNYYLSFMSR